MNKSDNIVYAIMMALLPICAYLLAEIYVMWDGLTPVDVIYTFWTVLYFYVVVKWTMVRRILAKAEKSLDEADATVTTIRNNIDETLRQANNLKNTPTTKP